MDEKPNPAGDDIVIESEVVDSGPIGDDLQPLPNALQRFQAHLPASMAQGVDTLVDSYSKNRKAYFIGAAIFLLFIIICIGAAVIFLTSDRGDDGNTDELLFFTATEGPIRLQPFHGDSAVHADFAPLKRPSGDLAISRILIRVVDNLGNRFSPLTVNTEEISIYDDTKILARKSALTRGIPPVLLSDPYVVVSEANSKWRMSADLVNVWGMMASTSVDAYIEYEVYYRLLTDDFVPVTQAMVGNVDGTDDVTPNCADRGDDGNTCTFEYVDIWEEQGASIVAAVAYTSIGATELKLEIINQDLVATSVPVYDEAGYISYSTVTMDDSTYHVKNGDRLRVTSTYANDHSYSDVSTQFCVWTTQVAAFEPAPTSSATSSPAASPSASMSPSSSVTPQPESVSPSPVATVSPSISLAVNTSSLSPSPSPSSMEVTPTASSSPDASQSPTSTPVSSSSTPSPSSVPSSASSPSSVASSSPSSVPSTTPSAVPPSPSPTPQPESASPSAAPSPSGSPSVTVDDEQK